MMRSSFWSAICNSVSELPKLRVQSTYNVHQVVHARSPQFWEISSSLVQETRYRIALLALQDTWR